MVFAWTSLTIVKSSTISPKLRDEHRNFFLIIFILFSKFVHQFILFFFRDQVDEYYQNRGKKHGIPNREENGESNMRQDPAKILRS